MRFGFTTAIVAVFTLVFMSAPHAETRAYRGELEKLNPGAWLSLREKAVPNVPFQSIKMRLAGVRGLPTTTFVFNRRKLPFAAGEFVYQGRGYTDPVVPVLLQGYAETRGGKLHRRVAASIVGDKLTVTFAREHRVRVPTLYTLTGRLTANSVISARLSRVTQTALAGKECDDSHTEPSAATSHYVGTFTEQTARVVTISTDADKEWFLKYGRNSNAEIASILNAAEAVYERELGIRFALVKNHTYVDDSSPYTSTHASLLLRSFATNPANAKNLGLRTETFHYDVDVKYLFTGKNLDGTTVGLAYIGAACWSPKQAYGLVQNVRRDYNITTFMHELGHTLGASHDTSERSGIMYPTLGLKNRFSEASKQQIYRHITAFGKCIEEKRIAPNLHNATLSLRAHRRRRVRFVAQLKSNRGASLSNVPVVFTMNNRRIERTTNRAGRAIIKLTSKLARKLRRANAVNVRVATKNGETQSRRVKVRLG